MSIIHEDIYSRNVSCTLLPVLEGVRVRFMVFNATFNKKYVLSICDEQL